MSDREKKDMKSSGFSRAAEERPWEEKVPQPTPTPVETLESYKAKLRPLMSTVMAAFTSGHPDLARHLQALSDMVQND